jgi:hypothetical protein
VRATALVALLLAWMPARALEVTVAESSREGDEFIFRLEARLEAPVESLIAVLTDFDHIHELHETMTMSRNLGQPEDGVTEVYTELRSCLAVFCRTLHRIERIRRVDDSLEARDVGGRSDFEVGHTLWRFEPDGEGTRLSYEARFRPAFWVPPLFGPAVLARTTRQTTIELLAAAESRARRQE